MAVETAAMLRRGKVDLLSDEQQIEQAYRTRSKHSFMLFARGLKIDAQGGPRVLDRCIAPFQTQCFEDLAPALEAVRNGGMPTQRRFWIERTKKASKDADLAVCLLWLLAFPTRPIYIQVGAANREQAAIVKERMDHLLHWNEWLNERVEIVQWEVRSKMRLSGGAPMAKLHIMSSAIAGSHGGTPDLLVINELSHVDRWEFVQNLMDNADGVAQGVVIIATNAGFKGTKAEVWRNNALTSDNWVTHILAKPAPWHTAQTIEDARRRNPLGRFNRLWRGFWASGKGEALNEDDIDRCFCLDGPIEGPEKGWIYVGGLDLGVSHDHSGIVILGINTKERKIKTAWWRDYPVQDKTHEVDLLSVKRDCLMLAKVFKLRALYYDPTEARLLSQELRPKIPMKEMLFSRPANLSLMASSILQAVESRLLQCYDDEDGTLRRDFGKFNIVEKQYGYKLTAVSDEFGHADVGTALVIALPEAIRLLMGDTGISAEDDIVDMNEEELTAEEIKEMPDELRALYEMYDEEN